MKGCILFLLFPFSIIAYGQSHLKNDKTASEKSGPNRLAGTWRLIEFSDLDPLTGSWIYPYGKNPRGYFTYTKSGVVNLNVSSQKP